MTNNESCATLEMSCSNIARATNVQNIDSSDELFKTNYFCLLALILGTYVMLVPIQSYHSSSRTCLPSEHKKSHRKTVGVQLLTEHLLFKQQ